MRPFPAALALIVLVPSLGAAAPTAPEPPGAPWIVAFEELPEGLEPGASFAGGVVAEIDRALGFALVETSDASMLSGDTNVRYVERDDPRAFFPTAEPNDPQWRKLYGPRLINAPAAWERTTGDTNVVVAVLDTGVRATHEDLAGRVLPGRDFHNRDDDAGDDCGHGTHVAGTVAATLGNARGVAGVAQVSILPVKVLGKVGFFGGCSGSHAAIASGIRYAADEGADVISMSLGGDRGSATLRDAVRYAESKGALLVAASGNSGPCDGCVAYPAAYEEVVAVGCVDARSRVCEFTSTGPELDLAAPGADIVSTTHKSDSSYGAMSGTSMAAPHVAGAAALLKSAEPSLGADALRARLESTAKDAGQDAGRGIVDLAAALGRDARAPAPKPPAEPPETPEKAPEAPPEAPGTVSPGDRVEARSGAAGTEQTYAIDPQGEPDVTVILDVPRCRQASCPDLDLELDAEDAFVDCIATEGGDERCVAFGFDLERATARVVVDSGENVTYALRVR